MEIISTNDGILCNAEVMAIIKDRQKNEQKRNIPAFQNREVLELQLSGYFSTSGIDSGASNAGAFITACRENNIDLTKAEYLQILNLLPTSAVEIHLIVEECSERLSEEQVEFMVESVESILKQ